jgi:hypothetical protein
LVLSGWAHSAGRSTIGSARYRLRVGFVAFTVA